MLGRGAYGFLVAVLVVLTGVPAWVGAVPGRSAQRKLERQLEVLPLRGELERLWGGNDVKYVGFLDNGTRQGLKVMFRPEHAEFPLKHRKEVAAYRLARACAIDQVPVTVLRKFSLEDLRRASEEDLERLVVDDDGHVSGALQIFVPGGTEPFEPPGTKWRKARFAVAGDLAVAIEDEAELRQFVRLVVFDYLQSNPDRFSGGNLLLDGQGRYWFIDNADTYFYDKWIRRRVERLQRFDRGMIQAIRKLSKQRIDEVLSRLLPARERRLLHRRVQILLDHVDDLVAHHGADAVLF